LRGKEDFCSEIETDFKKKLQSAAHSSSLIRSKLSEIQVDIFDMYLKFIDCNTFKGLVILNKDDFYDKEKRWKSYKLAEHINSTNSRIDLTFSFMSSSEDLMVENISSDGYIFKYGPEDV